MRREFGTGCVTEDPKGSGHYRWEFTLNGQRFRGRVRNLTRGEAENVLADEIAKKRQALGLEPVSVGAATPHRSRIAIEIIEDMERERQQLLRTITMLQLEIRRLRELV